MSIKERDVVLVSTNEGNDTIIDMPVTRENCVEGLGRIRGTSYSVGDVVLCAGSQSLQLICIANGTTSTNELDITGKAVGDTITDGTVTWVVAKRNYFDNSGTLPISQGGTGATTVAGARNNLGLGDTSGALPIANGGTGATTASQACANIGALPTSGGEINGNLNITGILTQNGNRPESLLLFEEVQTDNSDYAIYRYSSGMQIIIGEINLNNDLEGWLSYKYPFAQKPRILLSRRHFSHDNNGEKESNFGYVPACIWNASASIDVGVIDANGNYVRTRSATSISFMAIGSWA